MKNDQLGAVHGNRWTPLPLTTDDICGADWIARMEIEDPVVAREEREQTSLFRDPKTKNPVRPRGLVPPSRTPRKGTGKKEKEKS